MSKITCDVIRDLLPLYAENVASEASGQLIREHLESCESCRKELSDMKKPVVLPDFQKAQKKDTEAIANLRSMLRRKRIIQSVVSVLVVLILVGGTILGYLFYGRERGFRDICPGSLEGEISYASLRLSWDEEESQLSREQMEQLFTRMDQMRYKKLTMTDRMGTEENYATLRYTVDGHLYELMFSSVRGGCVLVNDVEEDGKSPLYRMVSDGRQLEDFLKEFQPEG